MEKKIINFIMKIIKKIVNFIIKNYINPWIKDKDHSDLNALKCMGTIAFGFVCAALSIKLFIDRSFSDVFMTQIVILFGLITTLNVWRSNSKRRNKNEKK